MATTGLFTPSDTKASFNAVAGVRLRSLNEVKETTNDVANANGSATYNTKPHDADGVHDIHINDPVFTRKGFEAKPFVHGVLAATKNRCVVYSNLVDIYREAIDQYNAMHALNDHINPVSAAVGGAPGAPAHLAGWHAVQTHITNINKLYHNKKEWDDLGDGPKRAAAKLEIKLRQIMNKLCQFTGFALGESKVQSAHGTIKQDGQLAVNRGGSVTVVADEQINCGDYVVVDYDWKDFQTVAEKPNQPIDQCMKLRLRSFNAAAERHMKLVSTLYQEVDHVGNNNRKYLSVGLVEILCAGAPVVIGQCKSGCINPSEPIDVKLESHIAKTHVSATLLEEGIMPLNLVHDTLVRQLIALKDGSLPIKHPHLRLQPTMAKAQDDEPTTTETVASTPPHRDATEDVASSKKKLKTGKSGARKAANPE